MSEYIIAKVSTKQVVDLISRLISSRNGIDKNDFSLADAKVFEIAARQIRQAYADDC